MWKCWKFLLLFWRIKINYTWYFHVHETSPSSLGYSKHHYHRFWIFYWKLLLFEILFCFVYFFIFDESLYEPFRQWLGWHSLAALSNTGAVWASWGFRWERRLHFFGPKSEVWKYVWPFVFDERNLSPGTMVSASLQFEREVL